jgi:ribosomal protein L29
MKIQDLASLSDEQLVHKEMELERSMLAHQFRHRVGRLENTSLLAKTRKDIARTHTEIRRREIEAGLAKGGLQAAHRGSFVPAAPTKSAEPGGGFLEKMLDGGTPAE